MDFKSKVSGLLEQYKPKEWDINDARDRFDTYNYVCSLFFTSDEVKFCYKQPFQTRYRNFMENLKLVVDYIGEPDWFNTKIYEEFYVSLQELKLSKDLSSKLKVEMELKMGMDLMENTPSFKGCLLGYRLIYEDNLIYFGTLDLLSGEDREWIFKKSIHDLYEVSPTYDRQEWNRPNKQPVVVELKDIRDLCWNGLYKQFDQTLITIEEYILIQLEQLLRNNTRGSNYEL